MKRLLSLLLALFLLTGAVAAFAETAEVPAEAEAAESAPESDSAEEAEAAAEPVLLVTVNGDPIYSDNTELQNTIAYYLSMLSSSGYDTTGEEVIQEVNQYSLLNVMDTLIIRQHAAGLGLDQFTDEEAAAMRDDAAARWQEILDSYATNYFGLTEESSEDDRAAALADALALVASMGYTEELFIDEMAENTRNNEIITRVQEAVTRDISVSDEEVEQYYDDLVAEDRETYENDISNYEFMTQYYGQESYYVPEGYRGIIHILLAVDETLMNTWKDLTARLEEQEQAAASDQTAEETAAPEAAETSPEPTAEPVTPEMVAAAEKAIYDSLQPKIDEIMAKYQAGTPFEDLIAEYGTDPGMENAATLAEGYAVHPDGVLFDSDFVRGAMALEKVGDVGEPVLTQFGIHILKYLRDIPGGPKPLTDALKEELRESMLSEQQESAFSAMLEQWFRESEIVYSAEGESWKLPEEEAADSSVPEEAPEEESAESAAPAGEPAEDAAEAPAD